MSLTYKNQFLQWIKNLQLHLDLAYLVIPDALNISIKIV